MYLDTNGHGPGGKPERDPVPPPQLTLRQQKILIWITGFNLVLLLIAPIGGATLSDGLVALFR